MRELIGHALAKPRCPLFLQGRFANRASILCNRLYLLIV